MKLPSELIGASLALGTLPALAAEVAAPATSAPSTPVGLLQAVLGLALVLVVILGTGWLLRRINPGTSGTGLIRVLSATSVGQRERVVLVEFNDSWLLLGVAPGQVSLLQSLPRAPNSPEMIARGSTNFIDKLKEAAKRYGQR